MTWKFKVLKGAFALMIVAGLAMAAGANYFDDFFNYFW